MGDVCWYSERKHNQNILRLDVTVADSIDVIRSMISIVLSQLVTETISDTITQILFIEV